MDSFDNDVKDWIKEVVANGYHKHNTPLELRILGYFYERLFEFESELIDSAVAVLVSVEDEATAGYYLNKAVKGALERTINVYQASVADHLRQRQEICGD